MRHWRTDAYFDGHPYLTADAAAHLLAEAAVLVGIDSLNVDDIRDGERRPIRSCSMPASRSASTSRAWTGSRRADSASAPFR